MYHIPTVAAFDQLFTPSKWHQNLRLAKHPVLQTRNALAAYHQARQVRHNIQKQLDALGDLGSCAAKYCRKKITNPNSTNPKHVFMRNLSQGTQTLIAEVNAHALAYQNRFGKAHHRGAVRHGIAHEQNRLGTGVRLLPEYRFEKSVATHGPDRRIHAGNFLTGEGVDPQALAAMSPVQLYELVKKFKHTDHDRRHLDYFDAQTLTGKMLTSGPNHTVLMNGAAATTTGQIEQRKYDQKTGALTNAHTGRFYMQNSGGNDEMAVYACSLDGDFFVHLDLADHAGTYQHSSIMSGSAVTCAGTIRIVNGVVKILTNNSGHYQPSAIDLRDAVMLMEEDLDVPAASVFICCKNTKGKYYLCDGETLLKLQPGREIETLVGFRCIAFPDEISLAGLNQIVDRNARAADSMKEILRGGWLSRQDLIVDKIRKRPKWVPGTTPG